MTIVGIDLGTTNSLVAVWEPVGPRILPNSLGESLTPSVVGFDNDGKLLVGKAAKERLITHPEKTAALFKRYMGSEKRFDLGSERFRPEELSALVIKSLKADAEACLGKQVSEAVISVPAYFSDAQRKATRAAGRLAGLRVERLINEPTAAAVAYGLHEKAEDELFLVFDLGGGTFDVSVLEFFDGVMEVRATAGDNFLGGEDFLHVLVNAFAQENNLPFESLTAAESGRLFKSAEDLKCRLSSYQEAAFRILLGGTEVEWRMTREKFEKLAEPLATRMRQPMERALQDAAIKPAELDAIVLVGGATRMPLVRSMVGRMFGRFPIHHLNPDEVVALGTAVQAGLKTRDSALEEVVLTDICPYTLGIDVAVCYEQDKFKSGNFSPIIQRGTVIPASRVERFYTTHDHQEIVGIDIYQGESRLVRNNIRLGRLEVKVPRNPAGQEAIDVRFTYDINGILEVEAQSVSIGEMKRAVVSGDADMVSRKDIQRRFKELEKLKIHPRDDIQNRTLLAWGERLYESRLGDVRESIGRALIQFEAAIDSQDPREIESARKGLRKFLRKIEKDGILS